MTPLHQPPAPEVSQAPQYLQASRQLQSLGDVNREIRDLSTLSRDDNRTEVQKMAEMTSRLAVLAASMEALMR